MESDKLEPYKRAAFKAIFKAHAGGLEGVSFSELVAYLRIKKMLDKGLSVGLSTAQAFLIVRKCQGDLEDSFVDNVLLAVECLAFDGMVIIMDEALIILTERGRMGYGSI